MTLEDIEEKIQKLEMPLIDELSLELIELNVQQRGKTIVVQLIADRPDGGITLDECSLVNKNLSQLIEENGLIDTEYVVEVNSPGLDRPLKTKRDFQKVLGREVRFHLLEAVEEKIEYIGQIEDVNDDVIVVKTKKSKILIPFEKIGKAVQVI